MKKYIFILLAVMLCANGYAQKGRHALGVSVNGAAAPDDSPQGYCFLGLKYQYNISNLSRIEVGLGVDVAGDQVNPFIGMNLHTFFLREGRVRPYLITGISFDNYISERREYRSYSYGYPTTYYYSYWTHEDTNESVLGGKVGLGLNCRLTHSLDLNIEASFSTTYMVFGGIAFAYNF